MITELLTTYRYHTEFVMMFGGLAMLAAGIYIDGKYTQFAVQALGYILAVTGASSTIMGLTLCCISIYMNGAQ